MTFIDYYFTFVVFLFGACWGSFLNVCIYRIPAEESVVKPRSHCPKCGYMIPWYDNIPLLSYIMLGAKCRQCSVKISPRYFLVEFLTAVLFVLVWSKYPLVQGEVFDFRFVPYWLMIFGLVLGTFVDIDHMWLPDRTTIGGMIIGPILSFLIPEMHQESTHMAGLIKSCVGMGFGFGILWLVSVLGRLALKKDAMGFGDVKLMGALGAFLGLEAVIFIIFISSLLGSVIGMSFIAVGRKEWQSKIPFGPYIALAAVIWLLGGNELWEAYVYWIKH
ncbi:MAG: prepilin peptidase [Kiritimatiellales bacterium]|nr:prepilin peptidase [Kiritimatiellales bacterium]